MADEGCLVGCAPGVNHDRQVAADAKRIHVVEKNRALCARKILNVVLGAGEQDIYAGLFHEPVELGNVKRNSQSLGRLPSALLHDEPPFDLRPQPGAVARPAPYGAWPSKPALT